MNRNSRSNVDRSLDKSREIDEVLERLNADLTCETAQARKMNQHSRSNVNRSADKSGEIDKILERLNAADKEVSALATVRGHAKNQSTYRSSEHEKKIYEQMSKQELLICLKREKENNKELRIEIEERNREVNEIKERIEKLERIVQKKIGSIMSKEIIESIVEEKSKKDREENQQMKEEMIRRIEEIRNKKEEKDKEKRVEIKSYQGEIQDIKWYNEMRERKERRKNVMIRGLEKSVNRNKKNLQNWINENLEVNIGIRNSWITKCKLESDELIGVELASWDDKKKVMEKKSLLKKKGLKVYTDNDLTWQERNVRRRLNELKAEKKRLNKDTNIKVGYYWIEIDSTSFVYDERRRDPGLIRVEG